MRHTFSPGTTLVELIVVIAILSLLAFVSFQALHLTNGNQAIGTDEGRVLAELNEARSLTLSSRNASQWGVHFATTSVTLFQGTSYSSGSSSNVVTTLNPQVKFSSIALTGGGSDVVFQRLTGATSQYGTTTLSLIASSTVIKTIIIYKTGAAQGK